MADRVLYVQYTNPAALPPLQHSSRILAEEELDVRFIGTAVRGTEELALPPNDSVTVRQISVRPTGWKQKFHYLWYAYQVLQCALRWSPDWVYVSNPIAAPVGLLISTLLNTRVVYHEHDSPTDVSHGSHFMRFAYWARAFLAKRAEICILPNKKRIQVFEEVADRQSSTYCVWNVPTRSEVTSYNVGRSPDQFYLHYHGSLVPARLPVAVVEALAQLPSRVQLRVAGFETEGARGYSDTLRSRARQIGLDDRVTVRGSIPERKDLIEWASCSHLGLSFMPRDSENINMKYMTGASNKPFDYMAAGLPLLVSKLPDWESMFVEPGFARTCDPESPESIAEAVTWYLERPRARKSMAEAGRRRIENEWNYEEQFRPIKRAMLERA